MITIILKFFASLINKLILLDHEAGRQLARLENQAILVEMEGLNLQLGILINTGRLLLQTTAPDKPNVIVTGTPLALLALLFSSQPNALLAQQKAVIQGDMEILSRLRQLLQELDIDWEEYLSRFTGDIPAHFMGNRVRQTAAWGRQTLGNLQQIFTEYAQEELQLIPPTEQLTDFIADVDTLRDDAERLQARFERLQRLAMQKDAL